ncbi:hypothetical protein [Sphingomonas adhaesiva]|uniref:hypothetical protein n=1 Tax=Sphingomonas adhaesiva TaxID=28212 RepID=UPI002FF8D51A
MNRLPRLRRRRALLLALCCSSGLAAPVAAGAQVAAQATLPVAALSEAERLDAAGRLTESLQLYRRALDEARDPALRRRIAVRIAIAQAILRPDSLATFAADASAADKRHLADVLALLGRPGAAFALAGPGGGIVDRLARAQWALAAGDAAEARGAAEQAFAAAATADDKRYALALLVEAYRAGGALADILPFLDARAEDEAVAAARVDVLLELGRTQPAIAAIERSSRPDIRRRLTGVLDLAGDAAASAAEYRRLIAADPHQPDLYARLAALYLTEGDEARAVETFRTFFAANRGRADLLTAGAQAMIAMGLQDQAVAMLGGGAGDPAAAAATHLFLFETWLDRGDLAKATAELQAVQQGDAAGLLTQEIADGYERLGRPADALALLRRREASGRPLGYDARVRIAELAEATGDTTDALARWRALWADTTLPARRRYLERQIVALAKRTGRIEPLAQDLAARLDAGTLRPGEVDLLVALRLGQDRPEDAADVVRRYAARSGDGERVVLGRLAQLYGRIRDYGRLEATLRRLIAVDPANRDGNVRQLILTVLRHDDTTMSPAQRQAELDGLMAQLSDTGGAGTAAFKATVYAQASLDAQALAALRAAQAARPDDPDALSRLATELKRQRRLAEAVALVRDAADRATTATAFAGAIDTAIDVVSGVPADEPGAQGVLGWAERRVLERIATDGADARMLGLLADIAAADADYDLQLRAVEARVPGAGEQRAYVLRELVTLAGGGGTDGGGPAIIGDARRKLVYARRLLALGKSFPPDLYADLATTFLAQGDEAAAEQAFAMMSGLGGLVNVEAAKGDAYAAAGRPAQALTNYARALLVDQANLDLLAKTAILYERAGTPAPASRLYWRGLRTLIARQPVTPVAARDERGLDVRRYYPTLVEGLLLSWPEDDAAAASAMRADLARRFAAEVATLDPARPGALADHPRLALVVDLGHRVVDARRGDAAIAGWDATLDRLFAGDPDYARAASLRRHLTGTGADAVPAGAGWPIAALGVQAVDLDNGELELVLAMARSDMAGVRTLLAKALAEEEASRAGAAREAAGPYRQSSYLRLVADAMDRLEPEQVRDLVVAPLRASAAREAILFDLFRADADRYARLQTIAGAPLLAPDALVRLTIEQGSRPLAISLRVSRRTAGGGADWLDQFSVDQLLSLYDGLATRLARGDGDSMLSDLALAAVLRRPLASAEQQRLSAILDRDIAVVRDPKARSGAPLAARLLRFDVQPGNRDLLIRAARAVAARYPDSAALPVVLERWYADDKPQALVALAQLGEALTANGQSTRWIGTAIDRHFADVERDRIAAFLADPHPDPRTAATLYQRFAIDDLDAPADRRLALTRKMVALDPADPVYRNRLLVQYAQMQDWAALAPVLRDYVATHRDDRDAATMLAIVFRLLDRPDESAATATAAGVDPDDAETLIRLLNRASAAGARGGASIAGLFAPIYDAYRRRDARRPAIVAVEARRGRAGGVAENAAGTALGPLLPAAARDPKAAPLVLRAMWRESAPVATEGDAGRVRRALVATLAAAVREQGVGAALIARPDMSAELQRYPAAMAPDEQARQTTLYDIGAYGPAIGSDGAARLRGMLDAVRTGPADADLVRRVVALADRRATALAPDDLAALGARLRATPVASPDARVAMARVHARSGDLTTAADLLTAAMFQMLYPADPLDTVDDLATAMRDVVAALSLWPDASARRDLHARLARILETRKLGPDGGDLPPLPPLAGDASAARPDGNAGG